MDQVIYPDYRDLLQIELTQRMGTDSSYSLRKFAADLKMNPSQLSEVLKKKHGISLFKSQEIISQLNWSEDNKTFFCELVALNNSKNELRKELARERLDRINSKQKILQIELDVFELISEWYHYAIIACTQLKSFQNNADWISCKLGVPIEKTKTAIDRMKRLNLLKEENGSLVPTYNVSSVGKELPSKAIQFAHSQWLKIVEQNFAKIEVLNREVSNVVLALTEEEFKLIKSELVLLRDRQCTEIKPGSKDHVYVLGHYLLPLTKKDI